MVGPLAVAVDGMHVRVSESGGEEREEALAAANTPTPAAPEAEVLARAPERPR